jgi:diguanylate cyclase (GGDEF)-like protein
MKTLIAEDDPVSRRLLEVALTRNGYEVVATSDGAAAWQALQQDGAPQLAILDWVMPGMDGPAICREVRRLPNKPYVYILLLTAKGRKQDLIDGLDAGADDYLIKPFHAHELRARLTVGRRIVDLHNQLLAACTALREQATHDPLTGVWHRGAILDLFDRECARAYREGARVGVIMADIDNFKRINDRHGHLAGDAVLCEAVRRMQTAVRPYDAIGRYGGEEFLIVLPSCDGPGTWAIAQRLRDTVGAAPVKYSQCLLPVTLSLGAVVYEPGGPVDPQALLQAADAALYRAKNGGRNRVEVGRLADGDKPDCPDPILVLSS